MIPKLSTSTWNLIISKLKEEILYHNKNESCFHCSAIHSQEELLAFITFAREQAKESLLPAIEFNLMIDRFGNIRNVVIDQNILDLCNQGQKIQAIKAYRERVMIVDRVDHYMNLKEAKDDIEAVMDFLVLENEK